MEANHRVINSSLKSILNVSLPLILSALSSNLLFLIDRMILAYYSIDSMNAAAISGNFVAIFCFMIASIAGVSEIYVGQNNGKKNYSELATPVWQMVYFSIIASCVLMPFAYFAEYINLLPDYCKKEGLEYQRILMYLSALPGIKISLASFFIGQGKTKIITYTVLLGAISDILLDIIFIFGYQDIIPAMGCFGAALATIFAELVQIIVLAIVFFSRDNRLIYGTIRDRKFNMDIFKGCLKIGYPMSIGRIFELSAWYLIYIAISYVSKDMAIIQGICVSIYIFFAFICDGISKSAATVSSNLIGQKDLPSIRKSLKMFFKIILVLGGFIMLPLIIFPQSIFYFLDMLHDNVSNLYPTMIIIFKLLAFEIIIEAMGCALWGILMSGGDTKYPMIVNLSALWGIVVFPVLILYCIGLLKTVTTIYWLELIWVLVVFVFFYKRYQTLKWYNLLQIKV